MWDQIGLGSVSEPGPKPDFYRCRFQCRPLDAPGTDALLRVASPGGIFIVLFCVPLGKSVPNQRGRMREKIHPKYHKVLVTCACGNKFETRSTKSEIRLEMCSACHPFFTGKQKLIDTAGRIERFQKRYGLGKAVTPSQS